MISYSKDSLLYGACILFSLFLASSYSYSQDNILSYQFLNGSMNRTLAITKNFQDQVIPVGDSVNLINFCSAEEMDDLVFDFSHFRVNDVFRTTVETTPEAIECEDIIDPSYSGQYSQFVSAPNRPTLLTDVTNPWIKSTTTPSQSGNTISPEYSLEISALGSQEIITRYKVTAPQQRLPDSSIVNGMVLLAFGTFSHSFTVVAKPFQSAQLHQIAFSPECRSSASRMACQMSTASPVSGECRIEMVYKRNDHVKQLESLVDYQHSIAIYSQDKQNNVQEIGAFDLLRARAAEEEERILLNNERIMEVNRMLAGNLTIMSAEYASSNQDFIKLVITLPNTGQNKIEVTVRKERKDDICTAFGEEKQLADDTPCSQPDIPDQFVDGIECPTAPITTGLISDTPSTTKPTSASLSTGQVSSTSSAASVESKLGHILFWSLLVEYTRKLFF